MRIITIMLPIQAIASMRWPRTPQERKKAGALLDCCSMVSRDFYQHNTSVTPK
jgi:hypothetical protein